MSVIKKVPITSSSKQASIFLSFDLLELNQYIGEANVAFRAVRSQPAYGDDIQKPKNIKHIGFSHVSLSSLAFVDHQGEPLQQSADFLRTTNPELRISIPDSDDCFYILLEWYNQETCEKWQAEYSCSRKEAASIQQRK